MEFQIERIGEEDYPLFEAMIRWRETGREHCAAAQPVSEAVRRALRNPNLYVYAARANGRYVGWISAIYLPKIGKWQGRGHVYVDELWVAPPCRRKGVAKALLHKADELKEALEAQGVRLYVNVSNPGAKQLYASCGFQEDGQAYFMEK